MGQTRVDLRHLLEDLRDAYPGSIEETILTEVVANSLDSGASAIRMWTDPVTGTLTVVDDGSGMRRRELARYHDLATSTKTRGKGIGFAGVGVKLGLLICKEVVTETRTSPVPVATVWSLTGRHKAPWHWLATPPGVVSERDSWLTGPGQRPCCIHIPTEALSASDQSTGSALLRRPLFALLPAMAGVMLALACGTALGQGAAITAINASQFRETLDRHRGEVLLVNFWATWCRPCLKEIPELRKLAQKHREQGLRLVPVSLDEPADLQGVVQPFLQKWFPGFESYARLTPDMDGMVSVVDPAWNELLPTSYVLDRAAQVRARIQGGKSAAEFEAAIKPFL